MSSRRTPAHRLAMGLVSGLAVMGLALPGAAHAETGVMGSLDPAEPALSLSPYDPAGFVDLYEYPDGPITGATYLFNPTANAGVQMDRDFARMRANGVNTVGFYNLVQMTDADRDHLFDALEANDQKAAVRIEWYDGSTFDFDNGDPAFTDAESVVDYYTSDDPAHGYTSLLDYLIGHGRLDDVAYFAVNMPVDDGGVTNHFVTSEYPDGRQNPEWASSQPRYADHILTRLREVLGDGVDLYLSVFYGWDASYPTPSYADIEHPADGYFFNNYSYPISTPPDETASASVRINAPRLQHAMDLLMSQYPTQPVVVEYGFHTVDFNGGAVPNQTAGVVQSIEAKRLALAETTDYYANGSSNGQQFNVRGTLYFAQNLYKEEGNPPAVMDWTLDYPTTSVESESPTVSVSDDSTIVSADGASGGAAVSLMQKGSSAEFFNLASSDVVELTYRSTADVTVQLSVNGASPQKVKLPRARTWATQAVFLEVPLQGSITVTRTAGGSLDFDRIDTEPSFDAQTGRTHGGATVSQDGVLLDRKGEWWQLDHLHGATAVTVQYTAAQEASIDMRVGSENDTITLPASGGTDALTTLTVPVSMDDGDNLRFAAVKGQPGVTIRAVEVSGQYQAEFTGGLYNGAHGIADPQASSGSAVTDIDVVGASVVFTEVRGGDRLEFRYAATRDAQMTILALGDPIVLPLPATGGAFRIAAVDVAVPEDATVIVQRNAGDQAIGLTLDWMKVVDVP